MSVAFVRFLSFLLLIVLANCKQKDSTYISERIIITGQIEKSDRPSSPIIAFDKIFSGYQEVHSKMKDNGDFRFDLESDIPFNILFICKSLTPILLYPGDSIHITIHTDNGLSFSGDRVKENHCIQAFLKLFEPIEERYSDLKKVASEQSQEEFLANLDSINNMAKGLLADFSFSNQVNNTDLETWLRHHVAAAYYSGMISYIMDNQTSSADQTKKRLDTKFPISEEDFINNSAINRFKSEYLYNKILKDVEEEINDSNYHQLMLNAICHFKKDHLMRQLLFIEVIYPQLRGNSVTLYEEFEEAKDTIVTNSYLSAKLDSKYEEVKSRIADSQSKQGIYINDSLQSTMVLLDSIRSQNKGKVIYMDLWATWCRQCQQEFKNQGLFKKALEGKDVLFVYLCGSSETSAWRAVVEQFKLDGVHIYLNEAQLAEFKENYLFPGFPSYYIIDKNGNLVQEPEGKNSGWRPSNPGTLEKINALLL